MKVPTLVAVSAAALMTLSACGSGSSSTTAVQPAGAAGGTSASGLSVGQTSLGKVLVDGRGMTLYVLSADGRDRSTCSAECLQFWPAVAPGGASSLKAAAGRTTTPDGTPVATVAGHPVYAFSKDQQPGDVQGEGITEFGGTWHAASPTGQPVTGTKAPSGASTSPSTGRGYAY